MKENYEVCHCMKVSYSDIVDALHENERLEDVMKAFEHVQQVTHCSTGCGGCHDAVLAILSDLMMGENA